MRRWIQVQIPTACFTLSLPYLNSSEVTLALEPHKSCTSQLNTISTSTAPSQLLLHITRSPVFILLSPETLELQIWRNKNILLWNSASLTFLTTFPLAPTPLLFFTTPFLCHFITCNCLESCLTNFTSVLNCLPVHYDWESCNSYIIVHRKYLLLPFSYLNGTVRLRTFAVFLNTSPNTTRDAIRVRNVDTWMGRKLIGFALLLA
jgi:hypothetical protein